ncbi:MAG TPA: hypothetical protein VMZ11_03185 [Mycobacteriales bacterium]|nr:hypothetical protein [Mycobacteriales bacterium]
MNRFPAVRFSQSARRHRIGKAHALHVMSTSEPEVIASDDSPRVRLLWIGQDDRGLDLEILAIVEPEYLLVIHVMPHHFRGSTP